MPVMFPLALVLAGPAPADLEKQVSEIFQEQCTTCHDSGSDEINLDVAPSQLTSVKSGPTGKAMVVPGKPAESYLIAKLTGNGIDGDPMPMGGDPLPEGQMTVIRQWISSLAPAEPTPAGGGATAGGATASAGVDTSALEADLAAKRAAADEQEKAVQAILEEHCTVCHDASSDEVVLAGDLDVLTGKSSKYTQTPFVIAGNVEGSYLIAKMTGAAGIQGDPMPQGGDPLPADQLAPVKQWITALGEIKAAEQALADAGAGPVEGPSGPTEVGGPGQEEGDGCQEGFKKDKKGRCKKHREPTSEPPFRDMFFINMPTTQGIGKNTIQFRITHHFGRIGTERGAFGLDAGAVMSLGVAYGVIDGLDIVLRRSNSRKGYELGVKYIPVQQEYGFPVSFGGYASIEYYRDFDTNTANPVSGNFQLMLSRIWFERWTTMILAGYYLRTNHAANVQFDFGDGAGPVAATDTRDTVNVGFATQIRLGKKRYHSIDLEYLFPLPVSALYWEGALADQANIGAWAVGWTAITPSKKHVFKVFLTNTREIHTNLVAPGGQTRNPFPTDQKYPFDFFLGFTISRKWAL